MQPKHKVDAWKCLGKVKRDYGLGAPKSEEPGYPNVSGISFTLKIFCRISVSYRLTKFKIGAQKVSKTFRAQKSNTNRSFKIGHSWFSRQRVKT